MVVISYCRLFGSIKETNCAYYPKLITQSAAMLVVACSFLCQIPQYFFLTINLDSTVLVDFGLDS